MPSKFESGLQGISTKLSSILFFFFFKSRYLEVLLKRVALNAGHIVYSPSRKAFVTVSQGDGNHMAAEEYADLTGGWINIVVHIKAICS